MSDPNEDLVQQLWMADPRVRRLSKRIRKQQEVLREHLTPAGWREYLQLEVLVNDRLTRVLDVVVNYFRKVPRAH
jgi:hypothetical protein